MRVLGIDPGSRLTGFGVVKVSGRELIHIASGCVEIPKQDLGIRLAIIFEGIAEVVSQHRPDVVAVEKVFFARNAHSALMLGHARGAGICAAVQANVTVVEYTASQVKLAIVGKGGAAKEQVQHMVRVLLGLTQTPQSDAADALACAICHIHTAQFARRLELGLAEA